MLIQSWIESQFKIRVWKIISNKWILTNLQLIQTFKKMKFKMITIYSILSRYIMNKTKIKIILINYPKNNLINSPLIPLKTTLIHILLLDMISPSKFNHKINKFTIKTEWIKLFTMVFLRQAKEELKQWVLTF